MDVAAWDAFVGESRSGNFFHTHEFFGYHADGRFAWDHAEIAGADGRPVLADHDALTERGVSLRRRLTAEFLN